MDKVVIIKSQDDARNWLLNKVTPTEGNNRVGQAVAMGLLGAGVGYLGGSQITKGIFNNRLQKARELGERSISNRRNEIVNDFGYFGNNYDSINVHDSTLSDGRLNKRVLVEKTIKDRNLGDKIQTSEVDDTEGGLKIKSKVTLNKTPKINKDYILSEPILQEGETLMEGIERLKDKFNDPNKNKSRRKY